MQSVLNFKKSELDSLVQFMQQFEELPLQQYQKFAVKMGDSSVVLFESGKLLIQGKNAERVKEKILKEVLLPDELVLGIDETGRGEDFGPLVVAAVLGKSSKLREVRDSKKTAKIVEKKQVVEKNAEQIVALEYSTQTIDELRTAGTNLNQIEAKAIDFLVDYFRRQGFLGKVVIDGSPLPAESKNIVFLPRADDTEPAVAAASIVAKFIRDSSKDKEKRKTWKKQEDDARN